MKTRPTIAIVVPGGIGTHDNIPVLLELLRRLATLFDLTIYSFSNLELHPSLTPDSCTVSFAPRSIKSNLIKTFYFIWKIRKDHTAKQFAVIHGFWIMLQGVIVVLSGKMFNIPSIVTLPGGDSTYIPAIRYGSLSNPMNKMLVAWCIHHASRIVLLTRFQQTNMQEHGISRNQISIIPYGVDTSRFKFQPRSFSQPLHLIYIGNLNRVKDPFTLIKTFYSLSKKHECRLTIIGSDILKGEVQKYARELGVSKNIRWEGKLSYDKIPSMLSSADVLLITSRYEGQAAVVLEAFASGVVVVGTNVGLLADLGDSTITSSPGDADSLKNNIEELILHPETISSLQSKNRSYAERFSAEWTFEEYVKLYNDLIAQYRH